MTKIKTLSTPIKKRAPSQSAPRASQGGPIAVRATRTRRRTKRVLQELKIHLPPTKGMMSRTPSSLQHRTLLPGTDLATLTVQDGWELYLTLPQGNGRAGTNAQRTPSDLGNRKRALRDAVLGHCGKDDLSAVPLSFLAQEWETLNDALLRGLKLRLGGTPDSKKASNLRSDLKTLRTSLGDVLTLPALAPKAAPLLRSVEKGRWQRGLRADQWPAGLRAEVGQMRVAYTESDYTGPGHRHFATVNLRERSFDNLVVRLNRLVDFLLHEEGLAELRLLDLIDDERLLRYRAWYFGRVTRGGYVAYQQLCSALTKIAIYLQATGQWQSGFELGSRHPDAPWMRFSKEGRIKLAEGHRSEKYVAAQAITLRTPAELQRLARRCRIQLPLTTDGRAPSARQIFRRRFAAMFFGLGIYMPLRGRNWREMRWGRNLKQVTGGAWQVTFRGLELKNGTYDDTIRTYSLILPPEAGTWIEWWREQLRAFVGDDFEARTPLVFPMQSTLTDEHAQFRWVEMSHRYLCGAVDDAALEGLGQRFRPHTLRHCVATSIIASGRMADVQQAATLLGDTRETVLAMYFKPDEQHLLDEGYYAQLRAHMDD